MTRPTMTRVMMQFAQSLAKRSICERKTQVGVVITDLELTNVVAIGYNGPARGQPHACGGQDPQRMGSCSCVHAESNALVKAPYDRGGLWMFSTLSPCLICARLIINSRVEKFSYANEYRDPAGLDLLRISGTTSIVPYDHDPRRRA